MNGLIIFKERKIMNKQFILDKAALVINDKPGTPLELLQAFLMPTIFIDREATCYRVYLPEAFDCEGFSISFTEFQKEHGFNVEIKHADNTIIRLTFLEIKDGFELADVGMIENGNDLGLTSKTVEALIIPLLNIYRSDDGYVVDVPEAHSVDSFVIPYESDKIYSFDLCIPTIDKDTIKLSFVESEFVYVLCAADGNNIGRDYKENDLELPNVTWRGGQMIFSFDQTPYGDVAYILDDDFIPAVKYSVPKRVIYAYDKRPDIAQVVIKDRTFIFALEHRSVISTVKKVA
jgi:hypothetical protein